MLSVEAVYENGVLKPAQPLPLKEREKVQVTIHTATTRAEQSAGVIPCTDPQRIEWVALGPELDFPPPPEKPGSSPTPWPVMSSSWMPTRWFTADLCCPPLVMVG